ncbi:aldo/keto reductase [Flavisphingomonas formosensis]|uniref:aldo/keto reductase n=1 Tax=Flavisphingomonas formosensis TaxID=861534 RepID=UPI0012F9BDAA|nr:aldo/keto reductase [Sphingomonas formosensis]
MADLRPLGSSGLATPPLVLGGNVFDWTADRPTSFAILDAFFGAGGTMVDTADVYSAWVPGHSGGESESVIGEWLRRRGTREGVLIATKVGMLPGEGGKGLAPARIAAAAEASLRRLGTDCIDLYYAHQDDADVPQDAVLEAFDRLVSTGKVRAIAASNFSADRLGSALAVGKERGLATYTVLQPHYNLLERAKFEGPLQQLCLVENVGVLPYYGLAAGFLTGKYRKAEELGRSVRGGRLGGYLSGRGPKVLAVLDAIAAETGATQAQIALAWLAAQPAVTAPIASATSLDQVKELIGAMHLTLNAEQLARLDEASA